MTLIIPACTGCGRHIPSWTQLKRHMLRCRRVPLTIKINALGKVA